MQNKDLRWVRPECDFNSDRAEAAPRGKKQRPPKNELFVDDGRDVLTVAQIADILQLSTDTIQRIFESEPGVIALGEKNSRGKRHRVTLRIPRSVFERVKRKLAKK